MFHKIISSSVISSGLITFAFAAPSHVTLPPNAADNARSIPIIFALPPQASEIAEGVFYLGTVVVDGRELQGIAFLHPRRGHVKPDGVGKPGGDNSETSSCYAFIARGAKWKAQDSDGGTQTFCVPSKKNE